MSTFLTRRDARQRLEEKKLEAAERRKETRRLKRYYSDLVWASKRRLLSEKEVYDLYKLSEEYSNYGPERLEYELDQAMKVQEFFKRHAKNSDDPYMNALQKHLYDYNEKTERLEKNSSKKLVYSHPTERLAAKAD